LSKRVRVRWFIVPLMILREITTITKMDQLKLREVEKLRTGKVKLKSKLKKPK